ncbi:MAG TPA: hypothetical protein VJM32_02830 [Candidatus Saccharimonadales bacterium]|nr:hypothetical protein [Candidatus Saccharimonadales bacterium]
MSDFTAWHEGLPAMPGFGTDVRILLRGRNNDGHELSIVVGPWPTRWEIGYVHEARPEEIGDIADDWTVGFTVEERFGSLSLDLLLELLWSQPHWEYTCDQKAADLARQLMYVSAVDPEQFEAEIAEIYDDPRNRWLTSGLPDSSNFEDRLAYVLRTEAFRRHPGGDPRHLVRELTREPIGMGGGHEIPHIRVFFQPGVIAKWEECSEAFERRLLAVLRGASIVRGGHRSTAEEVAENGLVLECGTYDREVWSDLDEELVNSGLMLLPNDPVVAVERGRHAMQVLVVLAYAVDDDDLERLRSVAGVQFAGIAKPDHVYNGLVATLLVPGIGRSRLDLLPVYDGIRREMAFFD